MKLVFFLFFISCGYFFSPVTFSHFKAAKAERTSLTQCEYFGCDHKFHKRFVYLIMSFVFLFFITSSNIFFETLGNL